MDFANKMIGWARAMVLAVLSLAILAPGAVAQGLTDEGRARIAEDRGAFLDAASTAIAWFGDARGLNAAAIDDFIAAERAERRAGVTQVLMAADLSADGAVTAAEVARIAPGLSPSARGKLIARQAQADSNGDGTVSPPELQSFARSEALRLVPEKRAEDLRLLLLFDQNGDGWLAFDEVRRGIADIAV